MSAISRAITVEVTILTFSWSPLFLPSARVSSKNSETTRHYSAMCSSLSCARRNSAVVTQPVDPGCRLVNERPQLFDEVLHSARLGLLDSDPLVDGLNHAEALLTGAGGLFGACGHRLHRGLKLTGGLRAFAILPVSAVVAAAIRSAACCCLATGRDCLPASRVMSAAPSSVLIITIGVSRFRPASRTDSTNV